jgi:PilZ domain/Gram-negative bacterial TonB protein C-terminal
MSTSLQDLPAILTTVERRFYPRIVPQAPIYLPMDEKNLALLLNISENGLLISTQSELPRNFVANVAMPLNGIPKPLQVTVRVVWSNETTMQAGIQLLNLSEHDREQIRRWGAQAATSSPQPVHDQPAAIVTASLQQSAAATTAALQQEQKRSLVEAMAAIVSGGAPVEGPSSAPVDPPSQTLAPIRSVENPKVPPTVASRTSSDVAPQQAAAKESVSPLPFSWFDQPGSGEISSPNKPEWGKLKWPVVIAALFLSGLYLVESGAISNPFRHSSENSEEAGLPPAPFTPTDQNIQRNLPSSNTPPGHAFSEPASSNQNVAPQSSEDPGKPNTLALRDLDKPQVQEFVAPLNPASHAPVARAPGPQAGDVRSPQENSRFSAPAARQNNSANQTPQSRNSSSSLRAAPSTQIAKINAGQDNSKTESNDQLVASGNPSASLNPSNSSAGGATSNPASESDNYSADASSKVQPAPASPPSYFHQPPATEVPRFSAPSKSSPGSSISNPSLRTTAPYSRINATPQPAIVPWKVRSPVIQMDVPERRVVTIHEGDSQSFINLPGERVLETSAATMRIQRSVRAPKTSGGWLLHRGKDKKVVLGDLTSRIDPQVPPSQLGPNDFVRVRATIAEDGSVLAVKPIHGPQSLVPVVLNAVNAWRFQPTYIDGKPVETESDVLIQFHPAKSRSARLTATQ